MEGNWSVAFQGNWNQVRKYWNFKIIIYDQENMVTQAAIIFFISFCLPVIGFFLGISVICCLRRKLRNQNSYNNRKISRQSLLSEIAVGSTSSGHDFVCCFNSDSLKNSTRSSIRSKQSTKISREERNILDVIQEL